MGIDIAYDGKLVEVMADTFSAPHDVAETLELIAAGARRVLGADRATCYVIDAPSATVASVHTTETDVRVREALLATIGRGSTNLPLWRRVIGGDDPLTVIHRAELNGDAAGREMDRVDAESLGMVRLEGIPPGGNTRRMLGCLVVSYHTPHHFAAPTRQALRLLGSMASMALSQAHLHTRTLDRLAEAESRVAYDPLTRLMNHRALKERLAVETARARRHDRDLALAVIDLDRFATVNTRYGHDTGDAIIRQVGARLSAVAGPFDVVARVGGERFALLMPESDPAEAWERAETARRAIADRPFGAGCVVTGSVGLCTADRAGDAEDLYRLAAGALYWAKQSGRNVTVLYDPTSMQALSADERADALARAQARISVRLLARVVDAKDPSTQRHSERVAALADAIAALAGWSVERRAELRDAALVHDVGKIAIPDNVLFTPARLSAAEYEQVKMHTVVGARMIEGVLSEEQVAWVRGHHERPDGTGYPDGLRGDEIPEACRIIALADAVDVMLTERPYSAARTPEDVMSECRRMADLQFDARLVSLLAELPLPYPPAPGSD